MTKQDFDNEYVEGKINSRTGKAFDWIDIQYAGEAWDSMTDSERNECTLEQMDGYIQDTHDAVADAVAEQDYE